MLKIWHTIFILIIMFLSTQIASASYYTYAGNFAYDNDVQVVDFSVSEYSTVKIRTLSYAGGINVAGEAVAGGGFDPVLSLFDGNGFFITTNDDYYSSSGDSISPTNNDPATGKSYDAYMELNLQPGDYMVSLTQWLNFFNGILPGNDGFWNISLGFFQDNNRFYSQNFVDLSGNRRTDAWALDIEMAPAPEPVPLPSAIWLMGGGLGALVGIRKYGLLHNSLNLSELACTR